jgi:uncharacterized protein
MIVDCGQHAGVKRYQDLFPFMPHGWQKHFDRYEWTGSVELASNHIRVSDKLRHEPIPQYSPHNEPHHHSLVIPYQGLTVNGWADRVGAKVYLAALNAYALEHWVSANGKIALVVSPHDPKWSADLIRKLVGTGLVAGVCIPLTPEMLGTRYWDPIYEACVEADLPVVIHYSGVEGSYIGAAPLSGAPHQSPLSRLILMPHLAESNMASLMFEGAFYRFPTLQILFAGFGFKWVPSLMRRVDQEWRNFRSDIPWVKDPPSTKVLSNMWLSSYPVGEAVNPDTWGGEFNEALRARIVFNSHAPFGNDTAADAEQILGKPWTARLMSNGATLLGINQGSAANDRRLH